MSDNKVCPYCGQKMASMKDLTIDASYYLCYNPRCPFAEKTGIEYRAKWEG
jgi:hypothetical protein